MIGDHTAMGDARYTVSMVLAAAFATACGGVVSQTPRKGIEGAALPYRVVSADGREVSRETFFADLGKTQAVCIGEQHTNPHDHWAQWSIVRALLERGRGNGVTMALGMEMFQRPFQGVLDDYSQGRIDDGALLSRSGWEERWGYDWELYSPIVKSAVQAGARLLALNVSNELKKKVSKHGLDNLSAEDREKLPKIDLNDKGHRTWWNDIMEAMGGAEGHKRRGRDHDGDKPEEQSEEARARAERIYSVQVLWDETMADTAATWLAGGADRQVLILAGNGHCHHVGIVNRLKKRGVDRSVSIRPIVDDGSGELATTLAAAENDYFFVMTPGR
jgi:uncharacterized iron-regulated protein